jgi:hypothetical protein
LTIEQVWVRTWVRVTCAFPGGCPSICIGDGNSSVPNGDSAGSAYLGQYDRVLTKGLVFGRAVYQLGSFFLFYHKDSASVGYWLVSPLLGSEEAKLAVVDQVGYGTDGNGGNHQPVPCTRPTNSPPPPPL